MNTKMIEITCPFEVYDNEWVDIAQEIRDLLNKTDYENIEVAVVEIGND